MSIGMSSLLDMSLNIVLGHPTLDFSAMLRFFFVLDFCSLTLLAFVSTPNLLPIDYLHAQCHVQYYLIMVHG